MWHEARRQEKLIRSQMIDSVKRNERRKLFYENVRKDPEQFMQIHGRKCQIHVDSTVARAAEASNILRKWQGDPNILIDRFDARAHLDFVAEAKNAAHEQRGSVDVEELQCEYERYRILILNEFERVAERGFLKSICEKEFWPTDAGTSSSNRSEIEKKKQLKDKKAAVAFSYDDTPTVKGREEASDESEDEEEIIEPDEFDLKFDINLLDAERKRQLNKLGMRYGISSGAFSSLLQMDRREQDETHQLKEIEKAKLALAGRQAKAERALLKKKRALIVGKGCLNEEATTTLLSFVAQNKSEYVESSSSSASENEEETTEFITTFGGDDEKKDAQGEEDDEGAAAVHGPALPSAEFRRIFELKTRRSSSPEDFGGVISSNNRPRYRSRSPVWRGRSRSGERGLRRSRSREQDESRSRKIGRSRSSDKERPKNNTVQSHERSSRRERSRSHERRRSRERNLSRERTRRSRSRSRSDKRRKMGDIDSGKRRRSESRDKKERRRRRSSTDGSYRRSGSPLEASGTGSILSPSRSNGNTSPLEIRSSMSESEKERIEVENRRRRIRRTAKMHRQLHGGRQSRSPDEDDNEKKAVLAHKLRLQMQKALRKTAEELKEEERIKHEEQLRERRKRDETLYEESLEIRRREREKRHRERRRRRSSTSSD